MVTFNALYPAIVETYMPAFLINHEDAKKNICRVYFSLSDYNRIEDIVNVQISVRNQNTNTSVLNSSKYPCDVMLTQIKEDSTRDSDDKYYIEIKPSDMEDNNFEIDEYYKVQIRFTGKGAAAVSSVIPQAIDSWLVNNLEHFSEWSSVCLVRGVSAPSLAITNWDTDTIKQLDSSIANAPFSGSLVFADENETETLRSYRVRLYEAETEKMLMDSGLLYSNNYNNVNALNYSCKYNFEVGKNYYYAIEYTTRNLYSEVLIYRFVITQTNKKTYNLLLTGYLDEEKGGVQLQIRRSSEEDNITGAILLRRSSSKDNFKIWEDMYTEQIINEKGLDLWWEDFTIESGVWYNYSVQFVNKSGERGAMVQTIAPSMVVLDDIFLGNGQRQLKVKFDPQVSSFKRNYNETKIDTIGSKYPYIRRSGDMNYVTMSIGGLISSEMDEDNLFTTKEELYGENAKYYEQYNTQKNISYYNDFVLERAFREKVMEFLEADEVKLFRSPTEGNFLVRLMDVNISPNTTLGRRLWSFTATAHEIDECTIDKMKEYKIIDIESVEVTAMKEISNRNIPKKDFIIDTIDDINSLPTVNIAAGSSALVVNTGDIYILSNAKEWKRL